MTKIHDRQETCPKEFRCLCGSLMARIGEKGIELKCKRCKRLHLVHFSDCGNHPVASRKKTLK